MVTNITIFEPHFEGSQFGPASIDRPGARDDGPATPERKRPGRPGPESSSSETGADGASKSRATMALQGGTVFVIMFIALWIVLSRLFGDTDDE